MAARPVRAAGRARDAGGRLVLWSVAEGARGRRWREATLDGVAPAVARSLTFETGPDRLPSRLEAATGLGLLTLHPEPHGVYGNVVGPRGVRPIAIERPMLATRLLVDGSRLSAAALAWSMEPALPVGDRVSVEVIRVELPEPGGESDIVVALDTLSAQRIDAGVWRLMRAGREPIEVRIDADGLPIPDPGRRWLLDFQESESPSPDRH
jgi:hypothetical protein